jgi:hypothetical protein
MWKLNANVQGDFCRINLKFNLLILEKMVSIWNLISVSVIGVLKPKVLCLEEYSFPKMLLSRNRSKFLHIYIALRSLHSLIQSAN